MCRVQHRMKLHRRQLPQSSSARAKGPVILIVALLSQFTHGASIEKIYSREYKMKVLTSINEPYSHSLVCTRRLPHRSAERPMSFRDRS